MERIFMMIDEALQNDIIQIVILTICMDTVFGVLRAIKQKKLNSAIGIDGAIRKVSMIMSIAFLLILDAIANINCIGFLPEEVRNFFGGRIGTAEFFGVLYIAWEAVSILKNMTLCGLPVKGVWVKVKEVLNKYTNELPNDKK